ncbi:Spb1 domain-containing protein [Colletotrichum karsti]|uniref:Spb1 domain-containing protein n=1 Tax=Colletotrichum karsti TaxID=1095194 RepID=A0A9P6IHW6_9PEZI|nr:Spb1 domain-containing protein [Colletotrichum karsti]KAF9881271.1 Spb1 domain-containing protein [Colletotrichum karsti]
MAIQKKHGKGRLDKWYKLAKEKGYRARAAFKLIQLNKKYGFLEKSRVVVDLCAAPGSWCQVAAETCPVGALIVGVDLSPIKPIPKVITFQSDITTDKCRATIRQHLKTWKADCVLHDGAPNVGTAWNQDSFNQAELVLQSMKLATEFLAEGGTFVTKVFRSKDYNPLLWVFNQLFTKVEATKPPSSRNVSAEIFVVCKGYKAPKRIDPRFLDPRAVFAELKDATPNNEAKVYNPETKKRKRDGYEEGDWTQHKVVTASEFIQTTDPIAILGSANQISFDQTNNGDLALAALDKLPETTDEIRRDCADLKVLGRKEFKTLLRWRLKVREIFGFPTKKTEKAQKSLQEQVAGEEVAEVESMDEELRIQEELEALKNKDDSKKKKERRKENEKKQKDIVRMQLNMVAPMDIGMEQHGPLGPDAMFALKTVDKAGGVNKIAKGRMALIKENEKKKKEAESGISYGSEDESEDEAEDRLERELDGMYDQWKERKAAADAKWRAKRAREEHDDDEWAGVSGGENSDSDEEFEIESGSDSDSDEDEDDSGKPLVTDLDNTPEDGDLSKRARNFFSQDIFKDIPGVLDEPEDDDMEGIEYNNQRAENGEEPKSLKKAKKEAKKKAEEEKKKKAKEDKKKPAAKDDDESSESEDEEAGFEVVKHKEEDWENQEKRRADGRLDIDIITAEAMTLAHQLATGEKTKHDLIDDGFNKWALKDRDGLPDWFVDDEGKHDRPQKPITKAAAAAIREKLRAYNARPIKKVREAKARKKFKAAQRLEKLKKKSDLLNNEEGMTEKEKADSIAKMMAKAGRVQRRPKPTLVIARGLNRGVKGRPKGVKGRYTIVDSRMKKDLRAQKRLAKKKK